MVDEREGVRRKLSPLTLFEHSLETRPERLHSDPCWLSVDAHVQGQPGVSHSQQPLEATYPCQPHQLEHTASQSIYLGINSTIQLGSHGVQMRVGIGFGCRSSSGRCSAQTMVGHG